MFSANLTAAPRACEWKNQLEMTLLIQTGDLVDRGPNALEAFECLQHLQTTAFNFQAQVIRLLGSKLNN